MLSPFSQVSRHSWINAWIKWSVPRCFMPLLVWFISSIHCIQKVHFALQPCQDQVTTRPPSVLWPSTLSVSSPQMDCSLKPTQRAAMLMGRGNKRKRKRGPEENGGGPLSEPDEGGPPSFSHSCWSTNRKKRRKTDVKVLQPHHIVENQHLTHYLFCSYSWLCKGFHRSHYYVCQVCKISIPHICDIALVTALGVLRV